MHDYFEINVSKDGRHLFATAPRSLTTRKEYEAALELLKEKFPEAEGYSVTATYWEHRGVRLV